MANVDCKVNFLSAEDTDKFTNNIITWGNSQKFIGLGIYSERAAQLLANVIRYKWINTRPGRYYNSTIGGGMIVQAKGTVAINCCGEVGILFKEYDKIGKFIRTASGRTEQIRSIRDKIANDLKNFWSYNTPDSELEVHIEGYYTSNNERFETKINYNEFRALYEVLKNRDMKRIKSKYGAKNFSEMVGKSNNDQFVVMATETIMNEIAKLAKERESEQARLKNEHRRTIDDLLQQQRNEMEASKNSYNEKIKELEDQIKRIKAA